MSARLAFWTVAYTIFAIILGGTLPSPLYTLYQEAWGLSPGVLAAVYAIYAIAVIVSLLMFGGVSDQIGRRKVLLAAVVSATAGSLVFATALDVSWLFIARLLQGLAVGLLLGTATAYLVELAGRDDDSPRGSLAASVANSAGGTAGPLLAGALAQFAPAPTVLPFLAHLALLAPAALALVWTPETVRPAPVFSWRPRRLRFPPTNGLVFVAAAVGFFTLWAVAGIVLALSSALLATMLHFDATILSGGAAASMSAVSAACQFIFHKVAQPRGTILGLASLALGLAGLAGALLGGWVPLFFAGVLIAGAGHGLSFRGTLVLASAAAPTESRSEALSLFYVTGYAGVSLPALGLAILADAIGYTPAIVAFAAAVFAAAVLVCAALLVLGPRARLA